MIIGGKIARQLTIEVFNPTTGSSCDYGEESNGRQGHTMCNNMVCGGERWGAPRATTCRKHNGDSSFPLLPLTTVEERSWHLCWGLQSGEVLLLGGGRDQTQDTTELISADGSSSSASFNLDYKVWQVETPTTMCNMVQSVTSGLPVAWRSGTSMW